MKKEKKGILFQSEIIATICILAVMIVLTSALCSVIYSREEQRCWDILEEHANEISVSIAERVIEDGQLLGVLADVIGCYDSMDSDEVRNCINSFSPSTISSHLALLLPDDRILFPDGSVEQSDMSFEEKAALGLHTSDRKTGMSDESPFVIYNFIPVVQDGETIAMLFGVIDLKTFPSFLAFSDYDGRGAVYLFDGRTGDDLMNTWHDTLGNAYDRGARPVKKGYDYEKMQRESLAGETGHIIFYSQSIGEYLYYYYRPVDINSWTMALSVQESIVFEEALAVKKMLIPFVIAEALVFLCYLSWMLWHVKRTTQKEREQNVILAEALDRAEKAGRAKSTFLSNMSHDIRTPMNAIIGFTSIAMARIDDKERVEDCLNKITSSSNHLLALINDVLDMSKIESGTILLREQECNLSDIMHNFMNIIQAQISAKELKLFIDSMDVKHENVYMDSLRFNQMLLNIVGNAIKYTEPGGSITIRMTELPSEMDMYGTYMITIKDTGVGMSQEYLPHVFDVFTREKSAAINKIEGTGLGLPITKHIVEIMGGSIEVTSELGKGTEFTVTFPLRLQETKDIPVYIPQLSGQKILIVDDDFDICSNVSKMLDQIGMVPDWTLSGKEAVLRASQAEDMEKPYSAYIIDWRIPDMGGIEVTEKIRSIAGNDVPILILTAYDYFDIENQAKKAGATAFCQKPLFMSDLRKVLLDVFGYQEKTVEKTTDEMVSMESRRILLAEDNELNREIAIEMLGSSHLIVETAVNGKIAVDMVEASEPGYYDAVLMDIQMPVMDGYQAAREIRKLEKKELAVIPIVAMTANAFEEDKQEALENGMDAHIAKPIDVETIIRVLETVMK